MSTFKMPNQGKLRQLNLNDTSGELWSSWNVDLRTEPGKVKLARPLTKVMTTANLSSDIVEALVYADLANAAAGIYALTDTTLYFSSDSNHTTWASVASATVANSTDATVFEGQLITTTDHDLDAWDGNTFTSDWWTGITGYSATYALPGTAQVGEPTVPFIIENVKIGAETIVCTAGSSVHAYTGTIAGSGTLTTVDLDDAYVASCIKAGVRKIFIGSISTTGEDAYVYEWDGASTNYTQAFPVNAKACLSMEVVDNTPVIITERGEIKMFNNIGFITVGQFPFALKPLFVDTSAYTNPNNTNRSVHPKGMKAIGRNIYIMISPDDNDTPIDERSHAGVWVFNVDSKSLTHLCSQSNEEVFNRTSPILILDNSAGRIFVGGDTITDGVSLWKEDLAAGSSQYGYFVTTELESNSVQDVFDEVIIKALLGDDDKIVVKYRTENDPDLPINATSAIWVDGTRFNTTTDLSDIKTRFDAGHRDEIEIYAGHNAGRLAHITNIEFSGSTYQVTVDESLGAATETSRIRFDNWKKVPTEMVKANGEFLRVGIGATGTWAQFKVELRGKAGLPEVREVIIKTNNKSGL